MMTASFVENTWSQVSGHLHDNREDNLSALNISRFDISFNVSLSRWQCPISQGYTQTACVFPSTQR